MSIAIPGALVIVTFLLTVMLTFSAVLGTTTTQGTSLQEAADVRVAQVAGELSIISTSTGDVSGGTSITVTVENAGAISYSSGDISKVDVLTKYNNATGDQVLTRLSYLCTDVCGASGSPGDDEWTTTGFSPDIFNSKMWDPDETATLSLKVVPAVGTGEVGTVVVAVPGGVSDSAFFNE